MANEAPDKSTSTGMEPNIAGVLCYLVGWITGIIFLLIEPKNQFVRFHAVQSILVFGVINIATILLSWTPIVGWTVSIIIWALAVALWIVLMYKAYQGEMFKLPWAGDIAEREAKKLQK